MNKLHVFMGSVVAVSGLFIASADENEPTGALTVERGAYYVGVTPKLSWNIEYPGKTYEVTSSGPIAVEENTCFQVRLIGLETGGSTDVMLSVGVDRQWLPVFYGNKNDISPSVPLYSGGVAKGAVVDIAVAGIKNGNAVGTVSTTGQGSAFSISESEESNDVFYTGSINGKAVSIQVTFDTCDESSSIAGENAAAGTAKQNKGHGNNFDGIDSDNPGNAPFATAQKGEADTDEGGGSGAAPSKN